MNSSKRHCSGANVVTSLSKHSGPSFYQNRLRVQTKLTKVPEGTEQIKLQINLTETTEHSAL